MRPVTSAVGAAAAGFLMTPRSFSARDVAAAAKHGGLMEREGFCGSS